MGEYEPDDSRTVTQSPHQAPGEPPRTGPRDDEARAAAQGHKPPQEKQGVADPEPEDEPTARDAQGVKQPGYASQEDRADGEETENGAAPLGK
jgi:hypothetical protein